MFSLKDLDPNNLGFDNVYTVRTREMFIGEGEITLNGIFDILSASFTVKKPCQTVAAQD